MAFNGQPVPTTLYRPGRVKISDGQSVEVTVPQNTTITTGKLYLIDGFLGVAMADVVTGAGETATLNLSLEHAEYETNQIDTSASYAKGDDVYWDDVNKRLVKTETSLYVGQVTSAKDSNNYIWYKLSPRVINAADAIAAFLKNSVQTGLLAGAPSNASTHADGSTYDFNANVSAGLVKVNDVFAELAASADLDLSHGDTSPVEGTDTDIIYTIVAAESSGTVSLAVVAGTAAPVGSVAAPTTAAITAAVGHAHWIRIANVQVHRSGASAVTQTYNNKVRPSY